MRTLKDMEFVKQLKTTTAKCWIDLLEDGSYYFKSINIHPFDEEVVEKMIESGFIKSFEIGEYESGNKAYIINGEEFFLTDTSWRCNNEYTYNLEKK